MTTSTNINRTLIRASILSYDNVTRHFCATPVFRRVVDDDDMPTHRRPEEMILSTEEAETLNVFPSEGFMEDYVRWSNFRKRWSLDGCSTGGGGDHNDKDDVEECKNGHPNFETIEDLNSFNDKGKELVDKLRTELANRQDIPSNVEVVVDDYQPLYVSIQVGDFNCGMGCGWWHVKDTSYGCVVPIQALPVSDELKSRLMYWRKYLKDTNWVDEQCRSRCNEIGHDIEEHILWELNVQFQDVVSATAATTEGAAAAKKKNGIGLKHKNSYLRTISYESVDSTDDLILPKLDARC